MHPAPTAPSADHSNIAGGAMTVSQFCNWACIGRTKMYAEVKAGRIKLRKIGSKTLILRADAETWLNALPSVSAA